MEFNRFQRLKSSVKPSSKWGPSNLEHRAEWRTLILKQKIKKRGLPPTDPRHSLFVELASPVD